MWACTSVGDALLQVVAVGIVHTSYCHHAASHHAGACHHAGGGCWQYAARAQTCLAHSLCALQCAHLPAAALSAAMRWLFTVLLSVSHIELPAEHIMTLGGCTRDTDQQPLTSPVTQRAVWTCMCRIALQWHLYCTVLNDSMHMISDAIGQATCGVRCTCVDFCSAVAAWYLMHCWLHAARMGTRLGAPPVHQD